MLARRCSHSQALFESGDGIEEANIVSGEFVVASGDPPEVFDLVEGALDQVAIFVEGRVEGSPRCGNRPSRDDRLCASRGDRIHGAPAIIAFVGQNMVRAQSSEERVDRGDVVAFAAGQNEANRLPKASVAAWILVLSPPFERPSA